MSGHIDKSIKICELNPDMVINVYPSVHTSDLLEAIDRIAATLPEAERNDAKRALQECLA